MSTVKEFGFGVPLVTAGNTTDGVNFDLTERVWGHIFPNLDVAVVLGTTGWGRNILGKSMDDAKQLVDLGVKLGAKHGKRIVVGAGAENPEHAIELAEYASNQGVFAILVTDPVHAASPFAQSFGDNPVSQDYLMAIARNYHFPIMDAVSPESGTIYMPYIFPQLTAGNKLGIPSQLGYPHPEVLRLMAHHAESTGKLMDGGKLTHEDKTVAQLYAVECPQLSFQAGFDHKAQSFLADPQLNFNGAIFGTGNLIPQFLGAHTRDCLRLRQMRLDDPQGEETFQLLRRVTKHQNQVNAVCSYMWDTPGAFIRLIHGVLGIGRPTHVPEVPQQRLEQLAEGIARDAPLLVPEMTAFNPETELSRRMTTVAATQTPKKKVLA